MYFISAAIPRNKDVFMKQMYSIHDKITGAYGEPVYFDHPGEMTRAIQMALEDPKSKLAKWPDQYVVYLVGHWDHTVGMVMPTSSGTPQPSLEVASLFRPLPKGGA